jgi:tartrate-resistant acid phosphatase type 5
MMIVHLNGDDSMPTMTNNAQRQNTWLRTAQVATLLVAQACAWVPTTLAPHPQSAVAPPAATDANQAHFAIIGDFGQAGINEERVAQRVLGWQPDFIVTTGDNNYPNGSAATIEANIGQYYHSYIAFGAHANSRYTGSPKQRFFPCLGNHDWRTPDAQPYLDYFALPGNGRYYSMTQGPIAFFMVDSDPHEPDGTDANSTQGLWLKRALAESRAPWKVVVMHHPPYSSGSHGSSTWMQWPYADWGADLILSGHDHTYEHVIMDGLNYVVVGLSGADKDTFAVACALPHAQKDNCYDQDYAAMRGHATSDRLRLELIHWAGVVQDTITLKKRAPLQALDGERVSTPPSRAK